jgi:predicted PurR-regulated permease PerM
MGLFAMVPMLGTFVIWFPAAIFLAFDGSIVKALILVGYGALAIGLVDNFLYPTLVGARMSLHTLPVFFALVGGLSLFGVSGLVLGPVIMAVTIALLQVWKQRTTAGQPAENALHPTEEAPQ